MPYALAAGEEDKFPLQLTAGNALANSMLKQPHHKPPPHFSWTGRASSVQVGDSSSTLEKKGTSLVCSAYSVQYIQGLSSTRLPLQCLLWGHKPASFSSKFHSLMVGKRAPEHSAAPEIQRKSQVLQEAHDSALPDESAHNCP